MALNWIDWIIIFVFVYEAYQGWIAGFVALGAGFLAFAASIWLAIVFNQQVAGFFMEKFGIPQVWSTIIGYILIVATGQIVLMQVLHAAVLKIPKKIAESKINSAFGSIVSAVNSLTIVALILLVIGALPLKGTVSKDIQDSKIGGAIIRFADQYGGPVKLSMKAFEKVATKFVTINPNSKESLVLDISPKPSDLEVDDQDERALLALVNAERAKAGVPALVVDVRIVAVARKHSTDMFTRRYFSHISPDGKDPATRMEDGEVNFSLVGENLAYSPDVERAHQGLMDSPEHKKNILDPQYHRIGIGIISTSSFGIMVTQNFAN